MGVTAEIERNPRPCGKIRHLRRMDERKAKLAWISGQPCVGRLRVEGVDVVEPGDDAARPASFDCHRFVDQHAKPDALQFLDNLS